MKKSQLFVVMGWIALGWVVMSCAIQAQEAKTAKAAAPIDLTGNWVSIVTEDYRWRMVTPLKGDSASVPVTAEARKILNAWDPAKDEAAGQQCNAYSGPLAHFVGG